MINLYFFMLVESLDKAMYTNMPDKSMN